MKRKQTFALNAPGAKRVLLAGDFTQWQDSPIPMKRKKNGDWETSVPLDPGTYAYRFLVDDQWRDDPACARHVPNPYGGQNAVVQVM
jgi:1,4-alpha-glucan branching enzyme